MPSIRRYKILGVFVFLFFCLVVKASGKGKCGIKNVWAFCQPIFPGNIPAHVPGGTPRRAKPDTAIIVYIETTDTATVWAAAWRNGESYSVRMVDITADSVIVGKTKTTRLPIIIRSGKKNRLLQLQFKKQPTLGINPENKYPDAQIILMGTVRHRQVTYPINVETEIMPQLRP
jgi:hypothetical protein